MNNDMSEMQGLVGSRQSKKACRRWCCCALIVVLILVGSLAVVIAMIAGIAAILTRLPSDHYDRAVALLERHPLIDGWVKST